MPVLQYSIVQSAYTSFVGLHRVDERHVGAKANDDIEGLTAYTSFVGLHHVDKTPCRYRYQ